MLRAKLTSKRIQTDSGDSIDEPHVSVLRRLDCDASLQSRESIWKMNDDDVKKLLR
jgi:hypothetical protein